MNWAGISTQKKISEQQGRGDELLNPDPEVQRRGWTQAGIPQTGENYNNDDGDDGDYGDDDGDKDGDILITNMPMRKILMIMN